MTTQDKDLAVAREMLDAEIAAMTKTLAERDALCEQQTRTIHGIPALMRERDAETARADAAERRLAEAFEGAYQMEGQANDQQKRADAAEQMVCEMRDVVGALVEWADIRGAIQADDTLLWPVIAGARHYITRTDPVAGRWVCKAAYDEAVTLLDMMVHAFGRINDGTTKTCLRFDAVLGTETGAFLLDEHDAWKQAEDRIQSLTAERDAAIAAKEVAEENWDKLTEVADGYYKAQLAAESREHALGVQVDALQKRLALFEEGAALLRDVVDDCEGTTAHYYRVQRAMIDINVGCFLAKVDAVPGDALATCKPGLQVGVEASGVDVERVSAPAYAGEDEVTP